MKKHFRGRFSTVLLTLFFACIASAWQCQEKPTETPEASGHKESGERVATGSGALGMNSVHVYFAWGNPPDLLEVMSETGLKQFSLAFIFSDGGCNPKWDGARALTGGSDQAAIEAVRARGGDVVVTFGGSQGPFLEDACQTPAALAHAYLAVIDAHALKAIDIDIESPSFYSAAVRARVVDALKIVQGIWLCKRPGFMGKYELLFPFWYKSRAGSSWS